MSLAPQHENLTGAESEAASAEAISGVLQLPGRLSLHHGGSLDQPSLAWRLAGKPGAPVVVALGGISAHRRVFDTEQPRAGWWCESPARVARSTVTRLRILGIDYLGGSGESTAPTAGGVFPSLSSYDQAEALRAVARSSADGAAARHRGRVLWRHGGAGFAERYADRVRAVAGHQRRRSRPSDVHRVAQRAAARAALRARRRARRRRHGAGARAGHGDLPQPGGVRTRASAKRRRQVDGRFVFPVEEYLFARGRDYAARYRAESFLCLSESIDLHAIDAARVATPTTLVAVREDQLVPVVDMRALAERLPDARAARAVLAAWPRRLSEGRRSVAAGLCDFVWRCEPVSDRADATTRAVRAGLETDDVTGAVVPPIHLSATYAFRGYGQKRAYDYSRSGNPTRDLLGAALADLEAGAGAVITATGMAAVTLSLQLLPARARLWRRTIATAAPIGCSTRCIGAATCRSSS